MVIITRVMCLGRAVQGGLVPVPVEVDATADRVLVAAVVTIGELFIS